MDGILLEWCGWEVFFSASEVVLDAVNVLEEEEGMEEDWDELLFAVDDVEEGLDEGGEDGDDDKVEGRIVVDEDEITVFSASTGFSLGTNGFSVSERFFSSINQRDISLWCVYLLITRINIEITRWKRISKWLVKVE